MTISETVRFTLFAAAMFSSGCTVISGAGDYKVDPEAITRDLDYEFVGMIPHANVALDVAVVDESNLLQARARIILPPPSMDYPTERLVMKNALTPGEQTLYFFADNDGDGLVDGAKMRIVEHIWIEKVDPDGVGEFEHNTNFVYFNEEDYTPLNGAFVLEMPAFRADPAGELLACIDGKLGDRLDVTLTLLEQDRQVGLLRRYAGTPVTKELKLEGVLDGGSRYRIEVLVDGKSTKVLEKQAPANDDLIVAPGEWFPVSLEEVLTDCR